MISIFEKSSFLLGGAADPIFHVDSCETPEGIPRAKSFFLRPFASAEFAICLNPRILLQYSGIFRSCNLTCGWLLLVAA